MYNAYGKNPRDLVSITEASILIRKRRLLCFDNFRKLSCGCFCSGINVIFVNIIFIQTVYHSTWLKAVDIFLLGLLKSGLRPLLSNLNS